MTVLFPVMASDRTQRQIDRLLDEAAEAFAQDDWRLLGGRALLLDPENPAAINFLAAAGRALDDTSQVKAVACFQPVRTTGER